MGAKNMRMQRGLLSGIVLMLACAIAATLLASPVAWATEDQVQYVGEAALPGGEGEELAEGEYPAGFANALPIEGRSESQIRNFLLTHDFNLSAGATYAQQPVVPTKAGKVSSATQTEALNALNSFRYIAGLDADVAFGSEFEARVQAAALANAANDELSHYPSQPAGMPDDLYQLGASGAGSSNIAYGYGNPAATVFGYMDDSDNYNVDRVGHRRWCLSAYMGKTAFGYANWYSAMYAFDFSRTVQGDPYIAWPAAHTPTVYFDNTQAWSLSYPYGAFSSKVKVTLTRVSDGKQWKFSPEGASDGECYYSPDGYGGQPAIIFRPANVEKFNAGDSFSVQLDDASTGNSFDYTVSFFTLFEPGSLQVVGAGSDASGRQIPEGGVVETTYLDGTTYLEFTAVPQQQLTEGMQYLFRRGLDSDSYSWEMSNPGIFDVLSHEQGYARNFLGLTPKQVGSSTVTVRYGNGIASTFEVRVSPYDIANAQVSTSDATYDGTAKQPGVTVGVNWQELQLGRDYTVAYRNNVNAGTAQVVVTGKGNYTGTRTESFTIYPASVWQAQVKAPDQTYTGKALTPKATVTLDGKTLKEGRDYTLSYQDNVGPGWGTVIVRGVGNYTGETRGYFSIAEPPAPALPTIIPSQPTPGEVAIKGIWKRLWGENAYGTMAAISNEGWSSSKTVVIATFDGYWDALSASSIAGMYQAPILLTYTGSLESTTAEQIARLGANRAIIVGGAAAITPACANQIRNALVGSKTVERIAGTDAQDTAVKVANRVQGASDTCIVATSDGYWDALAASPYAYRFKAPIYLTDNKGSLRADTVAAIKKRGFKRAIIVGGSKVVSSNTESTLRKAGIGTVSRRWGNDALKTSMSFARFCIGEGMSANYMAVATVDGYWDALTGGPLCGKKGGVLVLASNGNTENTALSKSYRSGMTRAYLLGGSSALSAKVLNAFDASTKGS